MRTVWDDSWVLWATLVPSGAPWSKWTGFWSWCCGYQDVFSEWVVEIQNTCNSFQCRFRDFSVNKNDPQWNFDPRSQKKSSFFFENEKSYTWSKFRFFLVENFSIEIFSENFPYNFQWKFWDRKISKMFDLKNFHFHTNPNEKFSKIFEKMSIEKNRPKNLNFDQV